MRRQDIISLANIAYAETLYESGKIAIMEHNIYLTITMPNPDIPQKPTIEEALQWPIIWSRTEQIVPSGGTLLEIRSDNIKELPDGKVNPEGMRMIAEDKTSGHQLWDWPNGNRILFVSKV